jgi:prepilin-type N-terminal cleavage/methylation domain-containing protein
MQTHFLRAKGFTLIELLVTMAIFVFVITIAVGALFSANQSIRGLSKRRMSLIV